MLTRARCRQCITLFYAPQTRTLYPANAHITLVDFRDTAIRFDSPRDEKCLKDFREETSEYLGSLGLERVPIELNPKLERFGKYIVATTTKNSTEYLTGIRRGIAAKSLSILGIALDDEGFDPHMSVAFNSPRADLPEVQKVPRTVKATGYSVDWRVLQPPRSSRPKRKKKRS